MEDFNAVYCCNEAHVCFVWQCQQNGHAIVRSANSTEASWLKAYNNAMDPLRIIKVERSFYKFVCEHCRNNVVNHFTVGNTFQPRSLSCQSPPNSRAIEVHYSFDCARQVHYPSDPLQPGPYLHQGSLVCLEFTDT